MDIINEDAATNDMITSRYSIVIAAAKRARQIVDGAPYFAPDVSEDKAVSIAVNELENGRLRIFPEGFEEGDEEYFLSHIKPRINRGATGLPLPSDGAISAKDYDSLEFDGNDELDDEFFEDDLLDESAYIELDRALSRDRVRNELEDDVYADDFVDDDFDYVDIPNKNDKEFAELNNLAELEEIEEPEEEFVEQEEIFGAEDEFEYPALDDEE